MRINDREDHDIAVGNPLLATPGAQVVHANPRGVNSPLPTASHPSKLAGIARQEIDTILASYRSTDALSNDSTTRAAPASRHNSTSTYSSEYSADSSTENSTNTFAMQPCPVSPPAVGARRRSGIPTQGGADRRRLAIVQVNTLDSSLEREPKKQQSDSTHTSDSSGSCPDSLHSRKGLALVAPPDASPRSYSQLGGQPVPTPRAHTRASSEAVKFSNKGIGHVPRKPSREVAIVGTAPSFLDCATSDLQQWSQFSQLDALKPPLFQMPQSRSPSPGNSEISDSSGSAYHARQRKDALAPGISPIKELKEGTTPVVTPNVGQSKHISNRVAGPIVINLCPESPSPSPRSPSQYSASQRSTTPSPIFSDPWTPSTAHTSPATEMSPYLYYQPGLHATAGPLPPPPVAAFNIGPKVPPPPRPPRQYPVRRKGDIDVVKQALQLPPHVAAALNSKSPSPAPASTASFPKDVDDDSLSECTHPKSVHVREGAFPPSRLCSPDIEDVTISLPRPESMEDLVASIGLAIDDMGIMSSNDVPPPTIIEPPRYHEGCGGRQGLDIRREENRKDETRPSINSEIPQVIRFPSPPRSEENTTESSFLDEVVPPVPAKNDVPYLDVRIKNVLNMKRFSTLPRTPSLMSLNRLSVASKRSSRAPSPSVHSSIPPVRPPIRRIKSASPSAMYFADVVAKKSPLERSMGYARKINELYHYDCGLGDWIVEVRHRATHPHSTGRRATLNSEGSRVPSTWSPRLEQRHFSQSSTDSGVTFPRRPDAYSATDLSSRTAGDSSPPNAPPPLPYPALAVVPRNGPSRASTIVATSSSSSARSILSPSKSTGGFFLGLGRKTSLKKEQTPNTPASPTKNLLSKSPPRAESIPRPVNVPPVVPSVPGGPRAPPNRMQRSQTIIVGSQSSSSGGSPQRSSTVSRRPSLFGGRGSTPEKHKSNGMSEDDFNRQLDRLAALLPRAGRHILEIYLRRTGQDMLALGQYIEDDKNGTYRYNSN
ncbi:hypothetical protein J3A83DRAFT_4157046 [Scleroderma citrinum]